VSLCLIIKILTHQIRQNELSQLELRSAIILEHVANPWFQYEY
jgi:hypothetical protein